MIVLICKFIIHDLRLNAPTKHGVDIGKTGMMNKEKNRTLTLCLTTLLSVLCSSPFGISWKQAKKEAFRKKQAFWSTVVQRFTWCDYKCHDSSLCACRRGAETRKQSCLLSFETVLHPKGTIFSLSRIVKTYHTALCNRRRRARSHNKSWKHESFSISHVSKQFVLVRTVVKMIWIINANILWHTIIFAIFTCSHWFLIT